MIKILCLREKKTITGKLWQNMLRDKTILPQQNLGY